MSPRNVLVLDSTQISTFLECPAKWQFAHKENLTLSSDVREDFAMGTYGHKLLEIYYRQKKNGASVDKAVRAALDFDFDEQTCECGHHKIDHVLGGEPNYCAEPTGQCECQNWNPQRFPLEQKIRDSVRQRFNEYWMVYSMKDIEPRIVEEGFSYELLNNKNCLYVLEGRIDIMGLFDGIPCFMDHKFQGRRHSLYSKAIQFRNYALATNSRIGIVNYIRLAKEVSNKTFERQIVSFSAGELAWWRAELIKIYDRIAYKISEANHFNGGQLEQNFGACSGKYGYPCSYTPICEEHNIEVQNNVKRSLFKIGKEWKPW